jgi:hypothetical protein
MGNCIFISANLIIKIHAGQASEVHEAEIREIYVIKLFHLIGVSTLFESAFSHFRLC